MSQSDDELLPATPRAPRRRAPWIAAAAVASALVVTGVVWNATEGDPGRRPGPSSSRSTTPTPTTAVVQPVGELVDNGNRCTAQQGRRLVLGIQVTNATATPVRVDRVDVDLPLHSLRAVSLHQSDCVAASDELTPFTLEAGGQAWVSAIFDVLVPCPDYAPVQFIVRYTWLMTGEAGMTEPSGFPDLGNVHYSGCGSGSAS